MLALLAARMTIHIFFECSSVPSIISTIVRQFKHWFEELLVWNTPRILPLNHQQESNDSMHLHVLNIVFRLSDYGEIRQDTKEN